MFRGRQSTIPPGTDHFSFSYPWNWRDSVLSAPRYPWDWRRLSPFSSTLGARGTQSFSGGTGSSKMAGTVESLTESRGLGLTFLDCFGDFSQRKLKNTRKTFSIFVRPFGSLLARTQLFQHFVPPGLAGLGQFRPEVPLRLARTQSPHLVLVRMRDSVISAPSYPGDWSFKMIVTGESLTESRGLVLVL